MNFGKIEKFVLFGGGVLLNYFSELLKSKNIKCFTFVADRHANEKIKNNKSLEELLKKNSIYNRTNKLDEKKILKIIGSNRNTLFISFDAPWIFSNSLIKNTFNNKLINCHGSRLPLDKGGGGMSWRILNYDRFGICLLHMVPNNGIDEGDIIKYEEFLFPHELKKPFQYQNYQIEKEKLLLNKFLEEVLTQRKFKLINQPSYLSSYMPRLSTVDNAWINWDLDIIELFSFICAFDDPYPGSSTYVNNKLVRVKSVNFTKAEKKFHPYEYGLVYRKNDKWMVVACNSGSLIIEEVVDIKGSNIFESIKVGDRFVTPIKKLEDAKKRFFYTPKGKK